MNSDDKADVKSTKSLEAKVVASSPQTSSECFKEDGESESQAAPPLPPLSLASSPWKETYWSAVASLAFLCTGLVRAYTSPALASIQSEKGGNVSVAFFSSSVYSRNDLISWIASSAPLASLLGTILSGPCLDQLGRRQTLFLLTLPSMLGWILIGSASSISSLLLGRALTGFAAGLSTATAPLYISEVCQSQPNSDLSQRQTRTWLGLLPGIMNAAGILLGFILAQEFQHWKRLAEVISLFPFSLCLLSLTIPESPVWLKGRNKVDEDKFDLEMEEVVPPPCPPPHASISHAKPNLSENSGLIPKRCEQSNSFFTAVLLPISVLMILQQFSGGNVLIFYLSEILAKKEPQSGNATSSSLLAATSSSLVTVHRATLIIGFVQFIGFLLALPLVDHRRVGRRTLLIISAVLMSAVNLLLGFHFHLHYPSSDTSSSWSSSMITRVTLLSALFSCYSIGLGPVPFLFIQIFSEKTDKGCGAYTNKVKSYLSSIASLVNHLAIFLTVKGFPYLFHMEGTGPSATFWFLSAMCWTAALFTFYFVPKQTRKC